MSVIRLGLTKGVVPLEAIIYTNRVKYDNKKEPSNSI